MTNEKNEFEIKGTPRELIFDNGKSYQAKDVFRGDSKDLAERNFQKTKDDSYQAKDVFRGDSKDLVERNFQKTKKIIDDGYQGDKPEENKR